MSLDKELRELDIDNIIGHMEINSHTKNQIKVIAKFEGVSMQYMIVKLIKEYLKKDNKK